MAEKKATGQKKSSAASRKPKSASTGSRKSGSTAKKKTSSANGGRKASAKTGKQPTARAASSAKKTNAAARAKAPAQSAEDVRNLVNELIVLGALALAILLFVGNIGAGGTIGSVLGSLGFGIFGVFNYIFPAVLFGAIVFFLANRETRNIWRKIPVLFLVIVFLCALLHLITQGSYGFQKDLMQYYRISAEEHTGGGILGGLLVHVFTLAFGYVGAWILTILGLVACLILLTRRPIFRQLSEKGKVAASRATVRREEHRRQRELEREQEEKERIRRQKIEEENARTRARAEDSLQITGSFAEDSMTEEPRRTKARPPKGGSEPANVPAQEAFDLEELVVRQTEKDLGSSESAARGMPLSARESMKEEKPKTVGGIPSFLRGFAGKSTYDEGRSDSFIDDGEPFRSPQPGTAVDSSANGFPKRPSEMEAAYEEDALPFEPQPGEVENAGFYAEAFQQPEDGNTFAKDPANQANAGSFESDSAVSAEPPAPRKTHKKPSGEAESVDEIREEMRKQEEKKPQRHLPSLDLLVREKADPKAASRKEPDDREKLEKVFQDFGVAVHVVNVSRGPSVTRYEVRPEPGVKVSRINNLSDDIKLNLAAAEIRIEAPIPGKDLVGIEVPNKQTSPVFLGNLLASEAFRKMKAPLSFAVDKYLGSDVVVTNIEKMPHLLIAGATGSGKSVCINTLIMSVLYKSTPEEVRMLMIDPKVVELRVYDGIPHLLIPVVTDPKKAAGALNWAVDEMGKRYNLFAEFSVRDLASYNRKIAEINSHLPEEEWKKPLPRLLIVVDELADLMMVAPGEVEDAICRLAQLARAAGIHLVIATQRPSVNVVTGLIKANMPSRIALAVSSGVDSRTIIDMNGAEKLLGKGDMLFYPQGYTKPARVQGAYVSDEEIVAVVEDLKNASAGEKEEAGYANEVAGRIEEAMITGSVSMKDEANERDEYFVEAGRFIIEKDKASIGMLQRLLKIGFNRAARIMDQLAEAGVVGPEEGTKPRKILMSMEEFERYVEEYV